MIIQLQNNISEKDKSNIQKSLAELGFSANEINTLAANYLVCPETKYFDIRSIGNLEGVRDIHNVSDPYQLVSRKWKVKDTCIDLGDGVEISRNSLAIMAGPCSIESESQIEETVAFLKSQQVNIMRGGVFKPRSSPYAFRGMGIDGLKLFYNECKKNDIKIISEVMQVSQIEMMYDYIDVFQVGARNSQNFNLLDALGSIDKPVLIKRGISGTLEELLSSAEYVFSNGNEKIILCERGIRSYEKMYRNTLDLNAVPILKEKTHLPVVVDPSHGIGIRDFVEPVALAAVMAGADGILVEIHQQPEKAASDGQQTLSFKEAEDLFTKLRKTFDLYQSFQKS